jgi:hypothetical protein
MKLFWGEQRPTLAIAWVGSFFMSTQPAFVFPLKNGPANHADHANAEIILFE